MLVRLAFIEDYTLKSLRLKTEKWNKLVISDDQRGFLHSFVDQGELLRAWAGCIDCGVECWRLPSLDTWLPVFFMLASNNLYHASRVRVPLRERNVLVFIRTLKLYIVPG